MPLFEACNLTVESNIPFPELSSTNGKKADLVFRLYPEDGRPDFSGELEKRRLRAARSAGLPWFRASGNKQASSMSVTTLCNQ